LPGNEVFALKNISVLGSTGSIGTQTLDVVRKNNDIKVVALSAGNNVELLEQQVREFRPSFVSMADDKALARLRARLSDVTGIEYGTGMDGLIHAAAMEQAEIVVTAVVGMMGIVPTIEAINAGKDIALANKETLVTAGHIIMKLAAEKGVRILPVDSEHSAIFQCLNGERQNKIHKILLTASGGPFRGRTIEQMSDIKVEDALKHPNWAMGRKITIDSSTMVNKGLEVMEARWLFGVELDQVQVVVQPQSVIHSMVEFEDGAVMAQLGTPDMRLPIQYALYYPERRFLDTQHLDFWKLNQITFEKPDMINFRGLALAYEAGRKGGNVPTMFNAANELAVAMFLDRKIKYLDIIDIIEQTMTNIEYIDNPDVKQILDTEAAAYEFIRSRY
jgi:1-deoxy-D-xylulose-5-phosphate reductoisomerase